MTTLLAYRGENNGSAEQMRGLLARLRSAGGPAFYAGLGRPYASALDLHRSYREARIALCGAQICGEQAGWRSYDDLGALRLLAEVPASDLEKHYEQLLGPLERYDLRHSTSLLETLHTYLLAGADAGIAAERLFIHENTLRYRLQKAGELLGLNLASPKNQTALYLLLTARSLHEQCRELLLKQGGHSPASVVPLGESVCLPATGPGPREAPEKLVAAFLERLVKGSVGYFAREVLAPLLHTGSRYRTLLETLQAYFKGGMDLHQIAVSLGIHVNTLRYRLKKIEEIYGAGLAGMETRTNLYLALRACQEDGISSISWE